MSSIKNLISRQGDFELNIPTLEWPENSITALTGASGAGKSSFALALSGLKPVEKSFEWVFKNRDLAKLSPPNRGISLLFQSLELFPHLSAKQNILFPAQAKKLAKAEKTKTRFNFLQKSLALEAFLDQPVFKLSGGEKQRVALARALILKADFLILDEPFSSLDKKLKEQGRLLLKQILSQDKNSILIISHSEKEIKCLAQKVFYLHKGRLIKAKGPDI